MKISVEHLTQGYGSHVVLDDISFTTESGKVTALLGPNGSGKSTLIKTIADVIPMKCGRILVNDADISAVSKAERAKMIGYVPQY
ncbi:MAG: ATP-binding cassette domain-containing protein, partial [Methanocorpusculum sp.]|nr:ATP-binding cassette domain-containing protein [Methanocorpusculum sp.]